MFQQQFWQHALQILQNLLHYSEIKIIKKILNIFLSFINKKTLKKYLINMLPTFSNYLSINVETQCCFKQKF